MRSSVTNPGQEFKIFVSYSRKDGGFAEELLAALEACGFQPYLDKHDIAPGEPWEERLNRLILESDTVVYVISPDSISSDRCAWEIATAEGHGKRLVPIVWRPVPDDAVPLRLKRLNYIFFSEGHPFGVSLRALTQSLNANVDWIREHTRLGELSMRWEARGRPEALLVRGAEIDEAKRWLHESPKEAPAPTDLQRAFIHESERHDRELKERLAAQTAALRNAELAQERLAREKAEEAAQAAQALAKAARRTARRTMFGLAVVLALCFVSSVLVWQVLEQRRVASDVQRAAEVERAIASEALAETSRTLLEAGDITRALQSAAEALRLSQSLAVKSPGEIAPQRDVAIGLLRLGDVLRASNKRKEALEAYDEALIIQEKMLGPRHPDIAQTLSRKAALYIRLGRYADAEPLQRRALAIREGAIGGKHPYVAKSLADLAETHFVLGRYAESEAFQRRALDIRESAFGANDPEFGRSLNAIGELYRAQGQLLKAEAELKRALATFEKVWGPENANVATSLNNLGEVYVMLERFEDADTLFRRSLAIREKVLGTDHPDVALSLVSIASLYAGQRRYAEAERYYERSLRLREKVFGIDHPEVGLSLTRIAALYQHQKRNDEAEAVYRKSTAVLERFFGPDHPEVGHSLRQLAGLYAATDRRAEGEALFKRAIITFEGSLGPSHPSVGEALNALGRLYVAERRNAEATPLLTRALHIFEASVGVEHALAIRALGDVAALHYSQGRWNDSLVSYDRATGIVARKALQQFRGDRNIAAEGLLQQTKSLFMGFVAASWRSAAEKPDATMEHSEQAFQMAQWAGQTAAGLALDQLAARQARGSNELSELVRKRQDLRLEDQSIDRQLVAVLSEQPDKRGRESEDQLNMRASSIRAHIAEIDKVLAERYPDYFAISSPGPVSIQQVQKLLLGNEAVVLFAFAEEDAFAWLVSQHEQKWVRLDLNSKTLSDMVGAVVKGFSHDAATVSELPPFDLFRSHHLYKALLGPLGSLTQYKHLLIVPSGPLFVLPFSVLVTEPPKSAIPAAIGDYRAVSWLGLSHPITILPSLASLQGLRQFARPSAAKRPYIGIGDPRFNAHQALEAASNGCDPPLSPGKARGTEPLPPPATKESVTISQTGPTSAASRIKMEDFGLLPRLPDTMQEICSVARSLGATDEDVFLGTSATERALKQIDLSRYRIVHFSTHGLRAGDLEGVTEPGLALTPPNYGDEYEDGFLGASEIARLHLDADLVIVSADGSLGDMVGGEAFSGLTRAFFFAGARALVASYYSFHSETAAGLVTGTIRALQDSPEIGRAEALRRAMTTVMRGGDNTPYTGLGDHVAHPFFWAPFVVVGEGAR